MDSSTPEGRILATLKHELKARGFLYRDIAARLRVSEGTIKRYFTGKGVSLTVLRKLAEIADLDLLKLVELAEQQGVGQRKFTRAQGVALARSKFLSIIYFLLWHGWSVEQIGREFAVAAELDAALTRLEDLGVIRRLSHEVKLLATPSLEQRGGPLDELTRVNARSFLAEIDLDDPRSEWICSSARLSRQSAARLHDMVVRFVEDARELMMSDTALPPEETQWYRLFVGAQPISRKRFLQSN